MCVYYLFFLLLYKGDDVIIKQWIHGNKVVNMCD